LQLSPKLTPGLNLSHPAQLALLLNTQPLNFVRKKAVRPIVFVAGLVSGIDY